MDVRDFVRGGSGIWSGDVDEYGRAFPYSVDVGLLGYPMVAEYANPTSTPQTILTPSGLLSLGVLFLGIATPAAKWVYVVFDAFDASDAVSKLGTAGARFRIPLGTDLFPIGFNPTSAPRRIDFATDVAAETGTTALTFYGKTR